MNIREGKCFFTSDNEAHETKLKALISQQQIDLRAIVQSDAKYGTRTNLSSTEVADLMARNAAKISELNTKYKIAINRARVNEKPKDVPGV